MSCKFYLETKVTAKGGKLAVVDFGSSAQNYVKVTVSIIFSRYLL